ncbi:MAG: response regulator [Proteobacteria bacterium]|nr:response regulator [Pseudomonadota bacterium]
MKQHVLVLDDDPIVRTTLQRLLERLGYDAKVCATPSETLSHYEREKPGIVIVDLYLNADIEFIENTGAADERVWS